MLSIPVFSRALGELLVVKVHAGWADTTGLGHWVVHPEGMLLLGHAGSAAGGLDR